MAERLEKRHVASVSFDFGKPVAVTWQDMRIKSHLWESSLGMGPDRILVNSASLREQAGQDAEIGVKLAARIVAENPQKTVGDLVEADFSGARIIAFICELACVAQTVELEFDADDPPARNRLAVLIWLDWKEWAPLPDFSSICIRSGTAYVLRDWFPAGDYLVLDPLAPRFAFEWQMDGTHEPTPSFPVESPFNTVWQFEVAHDGEHLANLYVLGAAPPSSFAHQ
jgi:hypothetical protein